MAGGGGNRSSSLDAQFTNDVKDFLGEDLRA